MGKIKIKNPIIFFLIVQIKLYQFFISPLLSANCRFYPTCSQYCIDSLRKFGFFRGIFYSFLRLKKCHPFGKSGYDPIKQKISFRQLTFDEIRLKRKKNLYNKLQKKLSIYKEDSYNDTLHFGLFSDEELVSGLTLIEKKLKGEKLKSYQIRGMFTVKNMCFKGYGTILMDKLIKESRKRKIKIIWCNSRVSAINFYKKNNFHEIGTAFHIKLIGKHQRLVRYI